MGVTVSGSNAYITDYSRGLRVIDMSDPVRTAGKGSGSELGFHAICLRSCGAGGECLSRSSRWRVGHSPPSERGHGEQMTEQATPPNKDLQPTAAGAIMRRRG